MNLKVNYEFFAKSVSLRFKSAQSFPYEFVLNLLPVDAGIHLFFLARTLDWVLYVV